MAKISEHLRYFIRKKMREDEVRGLVGALVGRWVGGLVGWWVGESVLVGQPVGLWVAWWVGGLVSERGWKGCSHATAMGGSGAS